MQNKIELSEDEQRLRDEEKQILRKEAEELYGNTKAGLMKKGSFFTTVQLIQAYVNKGLADYDKARRDKEKDEKNSLEGVFFMDEDLTEEDIKNPSSSF